MSERNQLHNISRRARRNATAAIGGWAVLIFLCACEPYRVGAVAPSAQVQSVRPEIVVGDGEKVSGTGALSVPTGDAIIARLKNGLEGNAKSTAGNFAKALAQVKPNLPKSTHAQKATGFDQAQLLVYGACSDLTTGTTPLMKSKYSVDPAAAISANQSALIAAGLRMLDQYTAGLSSKDPVRSQINDALSKLVTTLAGDKTNTSKIAFMSVCVAANTAGSMLLGF